MQQDTALTIVRQLCGELALTIPATLINPAEQNAFQLLYHLNLAGQELARIPWEELIKEWAVPVVADQDNYDLPPDWNYFLDQTQWDRTNHWPILGPRSAREWQWLKGGLLSAGPRLRYRVKMGKFFLHPAPGSVLDLRMEYISTDWVIGASGTQRVVLVDGDVPIFDSWLISRLTKLKFLQTKGLDTKAASTDFQTLFDSLIGKDVGAPVIDLAGRPSTILIGPQNVADGSWNVTP